MKLAAAIVHMTSWIVPADERTDWRREWIAELHARGGGRAWALVAFALGAPMHALWLRVQPWRPALIAGDLRFGLRTLRRRPTFAVASILTLALGIGASTAIFSVVYGILLKPLPFRDPPHLVQVWETNPLRNWTEAEVAPGNLISWRERDHVFADLAWYQSSATRHAGLRDITLGGEEPMRARALAVSANFFDVLGVQASRGRTFAAGEDRPGYHREIVLSDGFWRRRFAAARSVVGTTATLNGAAYTIIGVMPASFRFDASETDFWIPLAMDLDKVRELRRPHLLRVVARLRPGVTIGQAQASLSAIARDLEREYPDTNREMGVGVGPLDEWLVGQTRPVLLLFLGAVGLLLLIACANVANLFLARTSERVREMSVRAALGASRGRLVRQLIVESLVVAAAGTVCGVALAFAALRIFLDAAPAGVPRLDDVGLDPVVCGFAVALTGLTTLLVGLVPAFQAARANLRGGLSDGTRTTERRGAGLRRTLVAGEVALAVMLLVGALLTLRSFRALIGVDPGFSPEGLVSARVALPALRYGKDGQPSAFFESAVTRIRSLPGVVAAGATAGLPLEGRSWTGDLYIESRPDVHGLELRHRSITAGYLEALGVRVLGGRTIASSDRAAPPVVVVNETVVRLYFPTENPVGRRIAFDQPGTKTTWRTIVGIVADEPQDGLGVPSKPEVFESHFDEEWSDMAILVRVAGPPDGVVADIRRVVHDLDPQLAVYDAATFPDRLSRSLVRERFATWLVGVFAIAALVLAAVGIYGVASQSVASRTREIGVRVAFGATRRHVFRMIVREELAAVALGLVVGCGFALAASRSVASMLYGVRAGDPPSYGFGLAILFLTAVVACLVPARRAVAVDPVTALRTE